MNKFFQKYITKNRLYNLLSLINVIISFLFIFYLGSKFGIGKQTDIYFLSILVITYLGYIVQCVFEAMNPYYSQFKIESLHKSYLLYSILLNTVIVISLLLILSYFTTIFFFNILNNDEIAFLNIFIFLLVFKNILLINKAILNLEEYYASLYIVDILVSLSLLITTYCIENIIYIAYTYVFSTFIMNLYQFYLIFYKIKIRYLSVFYNHEFIEIMKNSTKIKLGSILYGVKDILIASIFTSAGTGYFTIYSYANRFVGVVMQVVNAPIVNVFIAKTNKLVATSNYKNIKNSVLNLLKETTLLFIISILFIYILLPFILHLMFKDKFSIEQIIIMKEIFILIAIHAFIIILESPFARTCSVFKLFNFSLYINIVFVIIILIGFSFYYFLDLEYYYFLYVVIIAQASNLYLAYSKFNTHLKILVKEKNEI